MKTVSRAAFGLALAMGVAVPLAVSPAMAAKEKKEKPAPAKVWKISKAFRAAYVPAEAAVTASAPDAQAKIDAAKAVATEADDKLLVGRLMAILGQKIKDTKMQQVGVVTMLESGSVSLEDAPGLYAAAGQLAYQAGNFPDAKKYLTEAVRLGKSGVDANLQLAEVNFKMGTTVEGLTALESAVKTEQAAGRKAPAEWYGRAAAMAYKAKLNAETATWTREQVRAYPTRENWRSALIVFLQSNSLDNQAQIDLYRLMHDTNSLAGERDFADYAALATLLALPGEAKSVIDEGFKTSAVSKTSQAVNERLADAVRRIPADKISVLADEKRAPSAADGRLAANTGSAYLAYGDYSKAIDLFRLAQQKGGVDLDVVNTRLGIALARSGQNDAAKAAFLAVVKSPRKEIAQFWLLWLGLRPTA